MYHFNQFFVRDDMQRALDDYRDHGVPLGDFLRAVVCNDFLGACGRADSGNAENLPAFAGYLYNEMPLACRGSMEAYNNWILRHQYIRLLQSMDWTYEASDDHERWEQGNSRRRALERLRVQVDANYELWNSMCPKSHIGGKGEFFGRNIT